MFRHIIDRSDLDAVVATRPTKPLYTASAPPRQSFHRAHIVLFNGTRSGKEYCLYVRGHLESSQIGGLMFRHIIDRSDLDAVVATRPVKPLYTSNAPPRQITLRQSLEERDFHRADIVLFNGTRSGKEYCLYVTPTGFMGDLWILDVLTNDEYLEVQEIANRMRVNAEECPPAGKLLRGW